MTVSQDRQAPRVSKALQVAPVRPAWMARTGFLVLRAHKARKAFKAMRERMAQVRAGLASLALPVPMAMTPLP